MKKNNFLGCVRLCAVVSLAALALSCSKKAVVDNGDPWGGSIASAEQAVDLGVSVLWSPWNVGAKSADGSGVYFAWGEADIKADYSWETYKWNAAKAAEPKLNKYASGGGAGRGKTKLDPADDPAEAGWQGGWRCPTRAEVNELLEKCDWEWKAKDNWQGNQLAGWLVSKRGDKSKSIFLPAAGRKNRGGTFYSGYGGYYWSSELVPDSLHNASILHFDFDIRRPDVCDFRFGLTVRPVRAR